MDMDYENELPLKSYLLGDMNPDEQHRLEQRLMIDSAVFDELCRTEDELIDDYLEGVLSGQEKEKFENLFLSSPERRQKLSFAIALRRYVAANRKEMGFWIILWNSWQAFWRSQNPVLRWSFAGSLFLLIAVGLWSTTQFLSLHEEHAATRDLQRRLTEVQGRNSELTSALQLEQARFRQLEQEAANLKSGEKPGSASLLPGQLQTTLISLTLTPGLLRDVGGSQKISIPAGTSLAQFDLKMEHMDYTQYQATLQRVGDGKIWTQISPEAESAMKGRFVRLIVPAELLVPADYVLKLSGVASGEHFEDIGSYYFRVTPK
jgi:hypothetical protein